MCAGVRERAGGWNGTWALAVVFGLASVPWTYGFVAGLDVPLWPSFVASATVSAVDADGAEALGKAAANSPAGVGYAAATLAAAVGMVIGALIGVRTAELSDRLA